MFRIKLADTVIQIDNHFDFVKEQCQDYLTYEQPSLYISLSLSEIEKERSDQSIYALDYCESLAVYRKICQKLIEQKIFLFHGAFFSFNGNGVLFIGPSGAGKTTQMKKWQCAAPDKIRIVNGDKPLFRLEGHKLIGYGTPWAGKENLQSNTQSYLTAIFSVEQSDHSYIEEMAKKDALSLILNQLYFPNKGNGNLILLKIANEIINQIPVFKFHSTLAAETAKSELFFLENMNQGSVDNEN